MDEKQETAGKLKIQIPLTKLKPGQHRALLVRYVMEEHKTETGLFIPSSMSVKDRHKNDVHFERYRYFVAAVSEDFGLSVKVGDEVYPIIYDDTTPIVLPIVNDYANNMFEYCSIHDSEVHAYRSNDKNVIINE